MVDELEQMTPNQRRALNKALSALETFAAIWAAEIRLGAMSARIASVPSEAERAKRIEAMIEQGFIEGAYRHYLDHKNKCDELKAARATVEQSAPEGWKLVPIEPTSNMVIDGFEAVSEFNDTDEFHAMSGCQRAAASAKVCYAAMLSSAPQAPQKNAEQISDSAELEALRELQRTVEHQIEHGNGTLAIDAALERLRAMESQRSATVITDAIRIDALEAMANQPGGVLLHDGSERGRTGLGLRPGALVRTLREAIDSAIESQRSGDGS
ncbi:hypothetical protein LJR034_004638 [Caballeronia sp. LjRoot34]|uniref:hypothetical protein n=1 Tax=Caballeronia sp. LjRoot34 TaxID=3342325 RepID=UPI003ED0F52E